MADIGEQHLRHAWYRGERFKKALGFAQDRVEGITKKAVGTLEVVAGAGIGGLIQGKAGPEGSHIVGIPTDLALGIGLNLLGYTNAAGKKYSEHLNNVGDGFLASFVSSVGFGWGTAWRETGKFHFGGVKTPGALPEHTAVKGEIHPAQMADIVARVQAAAARGPG